MLKGDTDPRQRLNYLEALLSIDAGLTEATRLLSLRGLMVDDRSERDVIESRRAEIETIRSSVQGALCAYLFDDPSLPDTNEARVAAIAHKSFGMFALFPHSTLPEILAGVEELVDEWTALRRSPIRATIRVARKGDRGRTRRDAVRDA